MRALIWNIRGFGHAGRRNQLKEYMRKEGIDIVGLQETIKLDFCHHELLAIDPLERFSWNHLDARQGTLGACSFTSTKQSTKC